MNEVLTELGINQVGVYDGDTYLINLSNDEAFAKVCSALYYNDNCELVEDTFNCTVNGLEVEYQYSNTYKIKVKADFDKDLYAISIAKI